MAGKQSTSARQQLLAQVAKSKADAKRVASKAGLTAPASPGGRR